MDIATIRHGMGLDELLAISSSPALYSSLKSNVVDRAEQQLNPNAPGGITELIDMFVNADSGRKYEIAEAIEAELLKMKNQVDAVIASDLDAQSKVRAEQAAIDLTSQIIPTPDTSPDFLALVATPVFKEILASSKNNG